MKKEEDPFPILHTALDTTSKKKEYITSSTSDTQHALANYRMGRSMGGLERSKCWEERRNVGLKNRVI